MTCPKWHLVKSTSVTFGSFFTNFPNKKNMICSSVYTLQKYYSMHKMSNLNKFKDSYQVWKKSKILSHEKKKVQALINNV